MYMSCYIHYYRVIQIEHISTVCWFVVLMIHVALAVFEPYRD